MNPEPEVPHRPGRFRYTLPGAWVALVFVFQAFTPSLLPRDHLTQGVVCGVSAAIGYGIGVFGAWVWRAFTDKDPRPARRRSWQVFAIVAAIAIVVALLLGRHWQGQIRETMGVEPEGVVTALAMPVVAAMVFVALVALGRGLRSLYRFLARRLRRWIGPRAASAVGWTLVVGVTYFVVSGLLLNGLVDAANQTFSLRNNITQEGVTQPTSPSRSGSTDSLVSWDSLGREGRTFVSGGPTPQEISAFSGEPADQPIRTFAGLKSADTVEERAALAVQDLERAGGFDREYLVVTTSTGSGWVSPGAADSFEYIVGGDSAMVSMQYSYLPSWISYLVDQAEARSAGRALFDAVYGQWIERPETDRPKLIIFGESLGTFGAESAFSGEFDLENRTSGALLTGPPNFNVLFREFTDDRDPGSPEVQPIYRNGRIVRFDSEQDGVVEPVDQPWEGTRVVYVMHASDPIVWWSPQLLLNEPDWLVEDSGGDVLNETGWFPFVTFWQITADLPLAASVPAGHGHVYTSEYVPAWVEILQPPGWNGAKEIELQAIIQDDE